MLVSFSVSNFRSFAEEQTFSLVASKRLSGSHEGHTVPIPDSDEKVLRTAVIYGANGAGKSNLFKALRYLEGLIFKRPSKDSGTGREPFRFHGASTDPSTFDLQFIAGNKLYRYGLSVDDNRIVKEWLAQIVGEREKALYDRETDTTGKVTVEASSAFERTAGDKLNALITVGGLQNQPFLATIDATLQSDEAGEDVQAVLNWFRTNLRLVAPEAAYGALGHKLTNDPDFLAFAGEFLKSASTGVDHLKTEQKEISENDLKALLPAGLAAIVLKELNDDERGTAILPLGEGNEVLLERKDQSHYYRITIQAGHRTKDGKSVPLDFRQESDGTRRLLNLLPALHHLRTGSAVYFIDEIDRSMHPTLVWKFLDFFLKSCEGGQRQIIVTTHESNLLDLDLLRRDEIWFAEKNADGATQLYSLVDFRVRNDLEIRKHYLQGRFGAIPTLGGLDSLLETEDEVG